MTHSHQSLPHSLTNHSLTAGGKDEDAPDSISPKYSTQWKTEYALDMDKQSGREQIISGVKKDAQGTSDVDREVYGDNDRDLGLMILGDMEAATDRGTYMLSKSKRVRQIDLSKQTDRHKPEKHIVDEMGNVLDEKNVLELDLEKHLNGTYARAVCYHNSNIVDVLAFHFRFHSHFHFHFYSYFNSIFILVYDIFSNQIIVAISDQIIHFSFLGFSNPISGVHDWKKQLGREDDPYTETAGTLDPAFHEDKLIIDPHDTATTKCDFCFIYVYFSVVCFYFS